MISDNVSYFSAGTKVVGTLCLPDSDGPHPAIVQGPGWLGLRDARLYVPYHEALTAAGFAVLIFDYRGFGDSDGDRESLSPRNQLDDMVNAVTYLQTRGDIVRTRIGVFGSGGTGGGNAVILSAIDERISCAVAQVPVADGEDWLRRMRREYEWYEFLERLEADRRKRVETGTGEMVHPRRDIMVPTPERRKTTVKNDVDDRIPSSVPLSAAEEILAYRPVDHAPRARNLMVIAVEDDPVTPTDHAVAIYEAARAPKSLILQRGTSHYEAYGKHGDVVIPEIVAWFQTHMKDGAVEVLGDSGRRVIKERQ